MTQHRNVKIVATLGPASSDYDTIKELHEAGVDVFRLNMSHGTQAEQAMRHSVVRQVEHDLNSSIGILADLQGPKLRVGVFKNGAENLEDGAKFRVDMDPTPGDITRVCLPHQEIFDALVAGTRLLVNDGKIRLMVDECGKDYADCTVVNGGKISDRKGVNVPDVILPLDALTKKDLSDLDFVLDLGVEWVGLSFVQRKEDMLQARKLVGDRALLMPKIEKPSAVTHFDEILEESDAVMVARGDLGVEMPIAAVPPLQKRMVRKCRAAAKPVIIATQMLESMIDSPMPTRAEVSDVATAIYEGADAIMLSAESAAGNFPVEAVQTMVDVAREVENDPTYRDVLAASRNVEGEGVADGIVAAAREIAETTDISAICCYTESGTTAAKTSRERPRVPVIAMTSQVHTARRLVLNWGIKCEICPPVDRFKTAVMRAARATLEAGYADETGQIVVTAGLPFNQPGTTNILRVAPCDERLIKGVDAE